MYADDIKIYREIEKNMTKKFSKKGLDSLNAWSDQ